MAYRANPNTAECWAGQRRIAREAGVSRKSVERWLPRLVEMGLLESVEEGTGPRPDCYRFAPEWVEGDAAASSVIEGSASLSGSVEGQVVVGEVIHRPETSGDTVSPLGREHHDLVATLLRGTGDSVSTWPELVATSRDDSGYSQTLPPAETPPKVLDQGCFSSREIQGVGVADSTACAVGDADAQEPPPIDPKILDELERRGLRPKPRPAPKPEQQPRSREEQLAILERIAAEDEAKDKTGQEGKATA